MKIMRSTILKMLVFLACLSNMIQSSCSEGCLRCDKQSSSCLLCDSTSNFYLTHQKSCRQFPNTNCLIPSPSSPACIQCFSDYILDSETLRCVPIPDYLKISNCEYYESDKSCLVCRSGYVSMKWECVTVPKTIDNCQFYLSSSKCGQCDSGYALSVDLTSCQSHSLNDCSFATFLKCNKCSSKTFQNSLAFFNSKSLNYFLIKHNWPLLEKSFRSLNSFSCKSIQSSDKCVSHDGNGKCIKCNSGFGVHPEYGTCQEITPTIDHCLIFSSSSTCSKCKSQFYLSSSTKCKPISPIESCLEYDSSADRTSCSKCIDSHFLKTDNVCSPRVLSLNLSHCIETSITHDKCQTCSSGYHISSNGTCLFSIPNCEEYHQSNPQHLSCLKCSQGYYFDIKSATCIKGKVPNCVRYSDYSTHCSECEIGFFPENGICRNHQYIHLCSEYSTTNLNKCEKCIEPNLLLEFENFCVPFSQVEHCSEYQDGSCLNCDQGYKLESNQCVAFTLPSFCLEARADNVCIKCQNYFYLKSNSNGDVTCEISNFYERENVEYSDSTDSVFKINGCAENAFIEPGTSIISRCYYNLDTSIADFSSGNSFVTNCQYYYLKSSSIKCQQCNPGFYLKNDNCVLECGVNPVNFLETSYNSEVDYLTVGLCDTSMTSLVNEESNGTSFSDIDSNGKYSHPYCSHSSRNFGGNHISSTSCSKCFSDWSIVPFISFSSLSDSFATIVGNDQQSFHPLNRNILNIGCLNVQESLSKIPKIIKNCALYSKENEAYGCIKCDIGYKGISKSVVFNSVTYESFIEECLPFAECKADSKYDGKGLSIEHLGPLNVPLESVLSCFECSSSTSFLVYFGKIGNKALLPTPYSISVNSNALLSSGSGDSNMQCLSSSSLNSIFGSSTLVSNCAVYFVDVTQTQKNVSVNATINSSGFNCLACQDGYKPTFAMNDSSTLRIVTSCSLISNCQISNETFNHCTHCESDYVFTQHSDKIDFTQCSSYPASDVDPNCLVMSSSDQSCSFCVEGYSKNDEGICDQFKQPFCNEPGYFRDDPIFSSLATINPSFPNVKDFTLLFPLTRQNSRGCSSCESGFTPLIHASSSHQCTLSSNLSKNIFTSIQANKKYIPNCVSLYYDNGNHKCFKCEDGFILLSDNSACIASSSSTVNCSLLNFSDPSICEACISPSVKAGSKCISSLPEKCSEFVPNDSSEILQCTKCASGYYLNTSTNSCMKGNFEFCKEFQNNDPDKCVECLESYMLLTLFNQSQCVYIPQMNCLGLTQFGVNKLKCSSCSPYHILSSSSPHFSTQQLSYCFAKNPIPHCETYVANNLLTSSASCSQCQSGYYLSSDKSSCLLRTELTLHCTEYSSTNQICKSCEPSYFLSENQCKTIEEVAQNCKYYLDLQNCQECQSNYYLHVGRCFEADSISNCSVWRTKSTCLQCQSGFALSPDYEECLSIPISNCLKTEAFINNKCIECNSGYQLQEDSDSKETSCIKIEDPNCLELDDIEKQSCSICKPNYQLNSEKKCTLIQNKILNCLDHSSESQCKQCKTGFYLTENKSECLVMTPLLWHLVDMGCQDIHQVSTPSCSICRRGYQDESGNCLDCSHLASKYESQQAMINLGIHLGVLFNNSKAVKEYFEESCDICSANECLICKSGFYMDSKGFCRGQIVSQINDILEEVISFTNPYDYSLEFGNIPVLQFIFQMIILSFLCFS